MSEQQPRDEDASARSPRRDSNPDRRSTTSKRDGDRKPPHKGGGTRRPYEKRDGDKKPHQKRDGDKKSYQKREGDKKPYQKREGDRPYAKRDGDKKPYQKRDGDRKPYEKREGDRPYAKRDGDKKPYQKRDGDRPYAKRDGDKKPYQKRDGDRPYAKRDSDRKPYERRDGDRKPYQKRDGDRPYEKRDGDRKPYARDAAGGSRAGRPTRGGAGRPDREALPGQARPERPRHNDPQVPDEITAKDLHPSARNELKTLSKENADHVARHLAMASRLIDENPALAHEHALAASRRAGRIAVVRETLAITAYATGDFALALRELRTYRRISGNDDQIALMVDCERGVGRPERALELGRSVDRATLPTPVRVELAIAMSGARLDMGEAERALTELDIPELDPDRAFEWSPALFAARATVLEELGRTDESTLWQKRAEVAADAIDEATGLGDHETIAVDEIEEFDEVDEAEEFAEIGDEDPAAEPVPGDDA